MKCNCGTEMSMWSDKMRCSNCETILPHAVLGELLTVCKQVEELRRMLILSEVIIEGSVTDLALRDLYNKAEKVQVNFVQHIENMRNFEEVEGNGL